MMIKREDLVAAAALDLLQYRQIDPLLVFLLQRDVCARRKDLVAEEPAARGGLNAWLSALAGLLAIVTLTLFAVLFSSRAAQTYGPDALFFVTVLYGLCTFGIVSWFNRRGFRKRLRVLAALTITSLPLAVFALQRVAG
jgi:hypothetical protein